MSPADSLFAPLPAPGPHPATAELRAYAAGTLALAEQHRIEAHMLECERCAELVDGFSMTDAAATDHAVAELRTRLHARIGTEAKPVAVPPRAWPRVAAAAALLGAVAGGIWTWEQREAAPAPTAPATVRLETTAPAAPSLYSAQAPATPSENAAKLPLPATTAPQAGQAADDYAAIAKPRPDARLATRQARPRGARPRDTRAEVADMEALANADAAEMAPAASSSDGWAASQPVSKPAAPAAQAVAASAPAREMALEEHAATTDTAAAKKYAAAPTGKAKAASPTMATDKALAARVRATPMPAAPAINPAPIGGTPALRDYLRRQAAEFEPENNALRLTGTVRLKFTVGADGKVSDLKVIRGLRDDYDDEALRMICEGPAWQPGITGGRRAPMPMEITVPF